MMNMEFIFFFSVQFCLPKGIGGDICAHCIFLNYSSQSHFYLESVSRTMFEVKCKLLSCVRFFVTPWSMQSRAFSRPKYWSGQPFPSPGDLPNPGNKPRSPALQAEALSSEPPGKSKNTGVGSLSLLQRIFPNQELNQGFLHCRQILHQLSYEVSMIRLSYV